MQPVSNSIVCGGTNRTVGQGGWAKSLSLVFSKYACFSTVGGCSANSPELSAGAVPTNRKHTGDLPGSDRYAAPNWADMSSNVPRARIGSRQAIIRARSKGLGSLDRQPSARRCC